MLVEYANLQPGRQRTASSCRQCNFARPGRLGYPRQPARGGFRQVGCHPSRKLCCRKPSDESAIFLELLATHSSDLSSAVLFIFRFSSFFGLFNARPSSPSSDFFFRFNPLSALAAMLAGRAWIPRLGWALVTVGLTILIGRVWCGWICPFGTLLEWLHFPQGPPDASGPFRRVGGRSNTSCWSVILVGSILRQSDPADSSSRWRLFTRAMTTVVIPALNTIVNATEKHTLLAGFPAPGHQRTGKPYPGACPAGDSTGLYILPVV